MFIVSTCCVCFVVRPSVGRGLRLDDVPCILRKLVLFAYFKALGETRVTSRKCFL